MTNNSKESVISAIGKTQDGKSIVSEREDRFNNFFLSCIEHNSDRFVNVHDLVDDFNYMINQIQKAKAPLQKYLEG